LTRLLELVFFWVAAINLCACLELDCWPQCAGISSKKAEAEVLGLSFVFLLVVGPGFDVDICRDSEVVLDIDDDEDGADLAEIIGWSFMMSFSSSSSTTSKLWSKSKAFSSLLI